MQHIKDSELILNPDGSIYHLNLLPEDIAEDIIIVGDPERVPQVSKYFDSIELKKHKRELITHTGYIGKKRITVLSTGMSTDNIDIVFNELDALANIDFKQRIIKQQLTSLNIIRIGTAGALQPWIPLDSFVVSDYGIGMDGLGCFYELDNTAEEIALRDAFINHFADQPIVRNTYIVKGSTQLINLLKAECIVGATVTCGGFYGPQGRILRAQPTIKDLIPKLQSFTSGNTTVANFEMETAGIHALGRLLGHQACSVSAIIANRCTQQFSTQPKETVDQLIRLVLEKISKQTSPAKQAEAVTLS